MMGVHADGTDSPLLSLKKRKKAIAWARSRRGDIYRSWWRHNAFVVSGKIGTKAHAQNCSQLVWAAFKAGTGVSLRVPNPLNIVDQNFVLPKEIYYDDGTVTYRTVRTDYGN